MLASGLTVCIIDTTGNNVYRMNRRSADPDFSAAYSVPTCAEIPRVHRVICAPSIRIFVDRMAGPPRCSRNPSRASAMGESILSTNLHIGPAKLLFPSAPINRALHPTNPRPVEKRARFFLDRVSKNFAYTAKKEIGKTRLEGRIC